MIQKPNIDFTAERRKYEIYPPKDQIFRAIDTMDPTNLKVIIIGQDPYHGKGEANGLAFSVNKGITIPPSLRNIYEEIKREYGIAGDDSGYFTHGDLTSWADQGVLLLNTILTVRKDSPKSHAGMGWEKYTDAVIRDIEETNNNPIVYMLWGREAEKKQELITNPNRLVLTSTHPSPFAVKRGYDEKNPKKSTSFFKNNHFIKANNWLIEHNAPPIDWIIYS